ncbi:MAG: acyl-CoA/acyl-ACP dehydrogenase [Alphaproteobacteria bacterium]|nr:acyl-CoA/acyl-ACP dehydrogenase [Alphaproteobacteria bacterium]
MSFQLNDQQQSIVDSIAKLSADFDDAYWFDHDHTGDFPFEFHKAMADGGWLGIAMPEEYGGAGLGVTEAALMMHQIGRSPGAMTACSSVHINIFGPHPIVVFGTDEQKQRWLPDLVQGNLLTCFGVTEPDAGLNTTKLKTRAERSGNGYIVNGKKIWTTTAQEASKILLLARTTAIEDCKKPTEGLSLFYTDLDRDYCDIREIEKMGRKAVDSNEVFFDGLPVPLEDRIGEEGMGFRYILHSMNPERILIGMEAVGIGQNALARAVKYAQEREVFDRPIGQNQSIQHPLAEDWMALEAAYLMGLKAGYLYDNGEPCGAEANATKYLGAEAGFKAATNAVMTHGGMGYAKEFHVERLLRESLLPRIAPVSPQMILNYIAERVLHLPKSY